ncbi:MAG: hypothetical protein K2Q18_03625, partial [Bdellovibrionales bacterium]|nr:hypothetical protein [Bdellovibrionales bacterium]
MKKLLILSLIFGSLCSQAEEGTRPSRLLLNAFGNQCPQVVTRNVSATLASLHSLSMTIEELKKDSNCSSAVNFSNIVGRYTSLYENFETESSRAQEKIQLEKKIALYSTMLTDPTFDSTQVSFIQSEIIQAQADLVNVEAGLARFQDFSGKEARVANQLVMAVDGFVSDMQTSQGNACYKKNAAQISSLMSNALLVTAAFATGGTSLALAGGAVLVKSVGRYVGDFKYNQSLENVNDIEMPTALRCVSQALTDQYCSASETQSLIQDRIDSTNTEKTSYDGINLLSYQLSPLSKWLEEVYAGSEITSQGDLVNREKPILQSEFLKKVRRYLETYGTIKRKSFLTIEDERNRSVAIVQAITNLTYLMENPSLNPAPTYSNGGGEFENPIFSTYSKSLFAYNLYEPGMHTSTPQCGTENCTNFSEYIGRKGIILSSADWDKILINANGMIQGIMDSVNLERARTISVDTYSILVNAKRDLKGELSPVKGLNRIIGNADRITIYLKKLGCLENNDCEGNRNKYFPQITNIQKTKDLSQQVVNLINEGMIPRSIPNEVLPRDCQSNKPLQDDSLIEEEDILEKKSFQITSCISRILKLEERGTDVYFTKVRNMVSYEMEARFINNDLGEGVQDVVIATRNDLVQSILNSYGPADSSISLGELDISLESAQNNSKETMNEFFNFFKKSLIDSLESKKVSETEKTDLCFRVLPYLGSAKDGVVKDVYENCQGRELKVYKNGPVIRFNDFVKMTPRNGIRPAKYNLVSTNNPSSIFCAYRKY